MAACWVYEVSTTNNDRKRMVVVPDGGTGATAAAIYEAVSGDNAEYIHCLGEGIIAEQEPRNLEG